jgi:hypothetical protein
VTQFGRFHHDPARTDDDLDRQVEACQKQIELAGAKIHGFAAAEAR